MDLWHLFVAAILGFVEGLTEFAPVSSTGHMVLVDDFLLHSKELYSPEVANTFKVVIQLGSILAVVIMFQERFRQLLGLSRPEATPPQRVIRPLLTLPSKGAPPPPPPSSRLALKHVFAGLLPAGILGVLFSDAIDEYLFSVPTVLAALVVGALFMIAADWLRPRKPTIMTVDQLTFPRALVIGAIQCLSLWPGFSRSGSTISGGVLFGLSHRAAADFSFILSVPIMLGASTLSLVKHWDSITLQTLPFFLVGLTTAFLCALVFIHFFLKLIDRVKLIPFAIYRIILACLLGAVFFFS